jgi:cysteine synthase
VDNKDSRFSIYRHIKNAIGNTPLVELRKITISNNNRIFAKLEYKNPGGSHYDRVYEYLIRDLERKGIIKPGVTKLIETTSGNGGASFAWIATQLGYESLVIIPADVAESRKRQIFNRGASLLLSPAGEYVQGSVKVLKEYLQDHKNEYKNGTLYCINHSQEYASVKSVYKIAKEITADLRAQNLIPDYIILACGNGTTILGVGGYLKRFNTNIKCVVFDPFEAPVAFEKKYPGRYEREYGVSLINEYKRHRILGTGVLGIKFPHVENKEFLKIVDEVRLVSDQQMILTQELLGKTENLYPGHSSAAAVSVALELAQNVNNKIFVVIFYDELNYYPETLTA